MSTPNQPPAGPPGSRPPLPPPAGPSASGVPQPPPVAGRPPNPAATPAPGSAGGGAAPPGPRPAAGRPAPSSGGKSGLGWKIATAVLAVTTVLGLVWGYMATKNADDTQAQMQAEIDQLKSQMTGEEAAAAKKAKAAAAELRKYRAQIQSLKGSLRVDTTDLKQEGQRLKKLRAEYEQAQQAASSEEATLNDKLNAANAKAALAQHCAALR